MLFKSMSYAVLSPVWGLLSDRVGCKKMLIRVIAGMGLPICLCFFPVMSTNLRRFYVLMEPWALLALRFTPYWLRPRNRRSSPSLKLSAFGWDGGIALIANGRRLLVYYLNYRPTYLIAALLFAGLIPLILFFCDEDSTPSSVRVEVRGPRSCGVLSA